MHIDLLHLEDGLVPLQQLLLQPLYLSPAEGHLFAQVRVRERRAGLFDSVVEALDSTLGTVFERLLIESPF